jgi:hypothetical protein
MHIRLSDRHAGKAAEAPVVPDRGFSAANISCAVRQPPFKNLLHKNSRSHSIEMYWRKISGFRLRLEAAIEPG